jgi:Protein of unknown function (DUF3154).
MAIQIPVISGLLDIGGKLIDKLIPDPEAKAKAQLELMRLERDGQLEDLKARMSAIMAEAQSSDPWTSRARPTFMYVFYGVIIALVLIAPVAGIFAPMQMETFFANVGKGFRAIPEELWWVFTAGYLGYTGFRSYEKKIGVVK